MQTILRFIKEQYLRDKKIWQVFLFLTTILIIVFVSYPQVDIEFSELFYNIHEKFFLRDFLPAVFLYRAVRYILELLIIFLLFALIYVNFKKQKLWNIFGNREIFYLLTALIVGPAIIINLILKDNFIGRARPLQIIEFGGEKKFTPAFVISDQCNKNCSFTSGHASMGFYFTSFALILPKRRKTFFSLAIVLGTFIGLGRIMQGGHFLSDVIFSAIIEVAVNYILYVSFFPSKETKKVHSR